MSILVVGSVALDTVKTPFGKRKEALGGSAVYFSTSAIFFSPVSIVAVIGEDFPKKYIDFLQKKGMDLRGLEVRKGKTFRWEGEYDWDFSNPRTLSTELNVFSDFNPDIPAEYRDINHVFLANIDPEIQMAVLKQMKKPRLIACDTMNYWIENKRKALLKLLKNVQIFLLNESEARELTGESNLVKASRSILKMGPSRLIIKKGEHGCLLFSDKSIFSIPAFLMESIYDPTGAGDTFAGGMMGYLASCRKVNETNLRKAIVYGSVIATFTVEKFSLERLGRISRDDITKRVKEFKKLTVY